MLIKIIYDALHSQYKEKQDWTRDIIEKGSFCVDFVNLGVLFEINKYSLLSLSNYD